MLRKLIQTSKSIIGAPNLLLESPVASEELEQVLKVGSLPSFQYYFMLGLSAVIATLGLIANSSATIIGAMIMECSFLQAIALGKRQLIIFLRAFLNIN